VEGTAPNAYPILFQYAIAALRRGDFTALEEMVGGSEVFSETVIDWHKRGYFANEIETLNEAFSAACMLGHERAAAYLLDKGVDPYAGMRTGLAGFHWAASSGRLEVVKLLIERGLPMEVQNMYEGTVIGQALWSARFEHTPDHAKIIELLIAAGAHVWPGTAEWWDEQEVPSADTKARVANALRNAE
jgi:ankyrin repeat protein